MSDSKAVIVPESEHISKKIFVVAPHVQVTFAYCADGETNVVVDSYGNKQAGKGKIGLGPFDPSKVVKPVVTKSFVSFTYNQQHKYIRINKILDSNETASDDIPVDAPVPNSASSDIDELREQIRSLKRELCRLETNHSYSQYRLNGLDMYTFMLFVMSTTMLGFIAFHAYRINGLDNEIRILYSKSNIQFSQFVELSDRVNEFISKKTTLFDILDAKMTGLRHLISNNLYNLALYVCTNNIALNVLIGLGMTVGIVLLVKVARWHDSRFAADKTDPYERALFNLGVDQFPHAGKFPPPFFTHVKRNEQTTLTENDISVKSVIPKTNTPVKKNRVPNGTAKIAVAKKTSAKK